MENSFMEVWHLWCIGALLLFILEVFTSGFGVLCFSVGFLGSAVAAGCGAGMNVQIFVFGGISGLFFVLVRPLLLKYFSPKTAVRTNTEALIGRQGIVSETIDNEKNEGRVKVDGDDWRAVTSDHAVIPAQERVEIIGVESIVLTVKKLES